MVEGFTGASNSPKLSQTSFVAVHTPSLTEEPEQGLVETRLVQSQGRASVAAGMANWSLRPPPSLSENSFDGFLAGTKETVSCPAEETGETSDLYFHPTAPSGGCDPSVLGHLSCHPIQEGMNDLTARQDLPRLEDDFNDNTADQDSPGCIIASSQTTEVVG